MKYQTFIFIALILIIETNKFAHAAPEEIAARHIGEGVLGKVMGAAKKMKKRSLMKSINFE